MNLDRLKEHILAAEQDENGQIKTTVLGDKGDLKPIPVGTGAAQHVAEGDMDHKEFLKLQSMLGGAKAKDSHTVVGMRGVTGVLDEGVDSRATIIFANCVDCNYTVNALCTKIFVQGCQNCTFTFNGKIVTHMVEIYKAQALRCFFNIKTGTLQLDMSRDLHLEFAKREHFHDIIWAGCHAMRVAFTDTAESMLTGFHEMSEEYADLVEERSQFKLHYFQGKIINEKVIRLENGFPTTKREKDAFDAKQELAMKALAQQWGITIPRKKRDEPKVGRNDSCPCGSGRKYKKCCGAGL